MGKMTIKDRDVYEAFTSVMTAEKFFNKFDLSEELVVEIVADKAMLKQMDTDVIATAADCRAEFSYGFKPNWN